MPHRPRPLMALLVFTGANAVLVQTVSPVYDFVCFLFTRKDRENESDRSREASSFSNGTNSTH
ncbi:unnamed protein product [Arabidopsis halleri]